jgi:hypothetical protein
VERLFAAKSRVSGAFPQYVYLDLKSIPVLLRSNQLGFRTNLRLLEVLFCGIPYCTHPVRYIPAPPIYILAKGTGLVTSMLIAQDLRLDLESDMNQTDRWQKSQCDQRGRPHVRSYGAMRQCQIHPRS